MIWLTIAKTINRNATSSLGKLVFICHLVGWGWVQVDEPGQVWAWMWLLQQIEFCQDLHAGLHHHHQVQHGSMTNQNFQRHTRILLISRPRPAPKSLEMLRAARGSLSSRDPRIENFGKVTFSLSIWRKEGLVYMWSCFVFMLYVHLEKRALSQLLWSCFFSPCRSRTWSPPSHQTLSRGWDAWRSPVFVILRALFKQFINEAMY